MLKIIRLLDKPAPNRNNNNNSAFKKINSSRSVSWKNNSNNNVDEFGGDSVKYTKKLKKNFKSQKLFKSRKKPKKRGNLLEFDTKKTGPNLLTFNTKKTSNYLQLILTEALILNILIRNITFGSKLIYQAIQLVEYLVS